MTRSSIAVIGLGGIARSLLDALAGDIRVDVRHVIVRRGKENEAAAGLPSSIEPVSDIASLAGEVGLVIEAAGQGAVAQYGADVLRSGRDFALVSAGALADEDLLRTLREEAARARRRLHLISGAIGGLDALATARAAGAVEVRYTGIKPPRAWLGTPAEQACDLHGLAEPTVVFEGSAREVARRYPQNANVAATVALAGAGLDATRVTLIADPAATRNSHRIEARGVLGEFRFDTQAEPSAANPKTSASTACSIVAYLRGGPNALALQG
ncbi:aspartate dehydrogenase [Pigmentiphaga sp.]|uniref:aspartate dehydrogenase n=1 Tax=Pigmentiphaga sp. TaxID=1977564 RepID=UPI00128E7C83|nr:aspartate dehydrogenase [Pigmentiphaga sp.]MPS30012.1 aspartate dehydrogenase [Alcaligenaceae bacterium SAGV5]MPS50818.1 aspartate dehydrogenase [Alcaligenaceae bacterium SAGV3]MPT56722.1 aspartate dehydrogenase [Alcaligenaceae bacterium]